MILTTIVEKTKARIAMQKQELPLIEIQKLAKSMPVSKEFLFLKALKKEQMSYILEVKKASPSKGEIVKDFDYIAIAKEYEAIGASAISVLTEPYFFQGSNQYLKEIVSQVNIPVLRKDFVIDPYMIYEAKVLGASAILLICSILTVEQLQVYHDIASSLGLSCLVETHNPKEIEMAKQIGAKIIGVNNRDLRDFSVNINHSIEMRKLVDSEIVFVSESGIQTKEDIQQLYINKVDAVLIGETIMKATNKKEALASLEGSYESY